MLPLGWVCAREAATGSITLRADGRANASYSFLRSAYVPSIVRPLPGVTAFGVFRAADRAHGDGDHSWLHRAPKSTVTNELEAQGRQIFRYDTFGDEQFWTDTAHLDQLIDKRESSRWKR
jgi:hypothetical protein